MVSSLTDFATLLRSEKVQPFVQTEGALREVHDVITELMKQLANEPSVGLYFVQQHVHKAVPGMVSLKTQMMDSTREVEYVTQDVKDALNSVKSMKEVGPAVIGRMMKTLDSSQPLLLSLRPSKRVSSAQVPLEKATSGQSASPGDYSGYMRTTFDSALKKASNMANVTKWNSYNRETNLESNSSGGGEDSRLDTKSEARSESDLSLDAQNVFLTAYSRASSLRKTASETSTGISTSEVGMAKDRQEVRDFSDRSFEKTQSLPAFREISDYGKPGQYVRAVFGSARQTVENVGKEATKFLSPDGKKPTSTLDKPVEGWAWFQVPSKAMRVFNKQPQTSGDLVVQEGSRDIVLLNEASSSTRSEEEIQQLLEMERASYEEFAAEKAAKLEEWLQDTEEVEVDRKAEIA